MRIIIPTILFYEGLHMNIYDGSIVLNWVVYKENYV